MKNKFIIRFTITLSFLYFTSSAIAEVAIITNINFSGSLDVKTAKRLFLGKTSSIPGVDSVILIGQVDSSPIKAEFTKKVTRKSLNKHKAHWSKMMFSGKALPPKELANDDEVKKHVSENKNTIGYIDASAVDSTVKILLLMP